MENNDILKQAQELFDSMFDKMDTDYVFAYCFGYIRAKTINEDDYKSLCDLLQIYYKQKYHFNTTRP
jgi:hypothetical protein